jgi:phosphonate transport system substrate-binding protein
VPGENAEEVARQYKDLLRYLEQKLGVRVEFFIATDYSSVIEAMRAHHIELAWYGPFSYVLAAQEASAEAFAIPVKDGGGKTYFSYFITRRDSGITTLNDLKGRTFAFGDPASASGHLIPRYVLSRIGITPERDFESVQFSGGHDATVLAVFNRKVDAGAVWDGAYHRLVEKHLIDEKQMLVFHKSDPIPESPWAYRRDLPEDLKARIRAAFEAIPSDVLEPAGYVRFEAVTDGDYDVIRETAKALNLDVKKLK